MRSSRFFVFVLSASCLVAAGAVAQDAEAKPAAAPATGTAPAQSGAPTTAAAGAEAGATSADTTPPAPTPQLVAEAPIVELGRLQKGERAAAEFVLANRGDAPLKIKSVQPACGCTVASFDAEIAPGATGKVRATLDTSTLAGGVAKTITVLSNDPKTPRATLTLRAEIVAFVEVAPGYLRLLQVRTLPAQTAAVNLWSGDGTAFEVLEVRAPQPWIQASARRAEPAERRAGAPDDQWRVEVSVAPEAPLGPLTDKLVVRTSHPRQGEIEVPLSGFVRPVLQPTPAAADFGTIGRAAQDKSRFVLKLFNFGSEPVEVRGAASDLAFLTATASAEEAGRRFRIELRLAPDAPKGKFEGTLRIETTSAAMPVVEIPVRGKVD
jgi:hypothetical protein